MRKLFFLSFLFIASLSFGQTTFVPDDAFEQYLITSGYDDVLDNFVNTAAIEGITTINISTGISDATGIQDFAALETLNFGGNNLTSINLNNNTNLKYAYLDGNELVSVDVSALPGLLVLGLSNNNLTAVDVSQNTSLKELFLTGNNLENIDVSNNIFLEVFQISSNELTSINVSQNTNLETLFVANNMITQIDVSINTGLVKIDFSDNNLTSLDLSNLNYPALFSPDIKGNEDLYCVKVTDVDAAFTRFTAFQHRDPQTGFSLDCTATTNIPDANFEQSLIDLGYDSGAIDGVFLTGNVSAVTTLSVSNKSIADLTGIEAFINLEILSVTNNDLTSVNLTPLSKLNSFDGSGNQLTTLDLSGNPDFQYLTCENNNLTSISNISNTQVINLLLNGNTFATIDVAGVTTLSRLELNNNSLTELNLSTNTGLTRVEVESNSLTSFNMKNGNNTSITRFKAEGNSGLTCIDVDDVQYSIDNWDDIDTQTSFSLDCSTSGGGDTVSIPDANFEQALIDEGIDSDGTINGQVLKSDIEIVTSLTIIGLNISDLTGIEAFDALGSLWVDNNSLTNIDLSQNTSLTILGISGNQLTSIDVSNNTALGALSVNDNQLTALDVSSNTNLVQLFVNNNQLSNLDISLLTSLEELSVIGNYLTSLDASQNVVMDFLKCNDNNLQSLNVQNGNNTQMDSSSFDATTNTNLMCIEVDDVSYSETNWTGIDSQTSFSIDCSGGGSGATVSIPDIYFEDYLESIGAGNGIDFDGLADLATVQTLTFIDLSNLGTVEDLTGIEEFTALVYLNASGNSIESVDLSANANLETLDLGGNMLTTLDVSDNANLISLTVSNNSLTSLNVEGLTSLEIIRCQSNQLTELDVTENTALTELNVSSNSLVNLNLLSNTNIEQLYAESNALEYLDLSQNASLNTVTVILNSLIGLNLKNGNNTNISNASFAAFDNPSLTCIQVDDVNYSNTNWGQIDMASSFSVNCTPVNDDCSFTIPIVLGQDTPGDTTSASAGAGNPSCAQNGIVLFDVWYEVQAPASGSIVLSLSAQPLIAKIAIYDSCSASQPFACDEETLSVDNLTPGDTYYLQVWLESNSERTNQTGATGSFSMNVQDATVLSLQDEIITTNNIITYPNPSKNEINIQLQNNDSVESIEVYSLLGKKINILNQNKNRLDISHLSKGVYVIKIQGSRKSYTKKFIKN